MNMKYLKKKKEITRVKAKMQQCARILLNNRKILRYIK